MKISLSRSVIDLIYACVIFHVNSKIYGTDKARIITGAGKIYVPLILSIIFLGILVRVVLSQKVTLSY